MLRTLATAIGSNVCHIAVAIPQLIILSFSARTVPTLPPIAFEKANARFLLSSTQGLAGPFVDAFFQQRRLTISCHPVTVGPRLQFFARERRACQGTGECVLVARLGLGLGLCPWRPCLCRPRECECRPKRLCTCTGCGKDCGHERFC